MMQQLQEKDVQLKRSADDEKDTRLAFVNKKKQMKQSISSLQKDVDAAILACEQYDSCNKSVALVSNHGDIISRLTIFNNTWHAKKRCC